MRTKHCNIDICFLKLFKTGLGYCSVCQDSCLKFGSVFLPDLFCFLQPVRSQASVFVGIYSFVFFFQIEILIFLYAWIYTYFSVYLSFSFLEFCIVTIGLGSVATLSI